MPLSLNFYPAPVDGSWLPFSKNWQVRIRLSQRDDNFIIRYLEATGEGHLLIMEALWPGVAVYQEMLRGRSFKHTDGGMAFADAHLNGDVRAAYRFANSIVHPTSVRSWFPFTFAPAALPLMTFAGDAALKDTYDAIATHHGGPAQTPEGSEAMVVALTPLDIKQNPEGERHPPLVANLNILPFEGWLNYLRDQMPKGTEVFLLRRDRGSDTWQVGYHSTPRARLVGRVLAASGWFGGVESGSELARVLGESAGLIKPARDLDEVTQGRFLTDLDTPIISRTLRAHLDFVGSTLPAGEPINLVIMGGVRQQTVREDGITSRGYGLPQGLFVRTIAQYVDEVEGLVAPRTAGIKTLEQLAVWDGAQRGHQRAIAKGVVPVVVHKKEAGSDLYRQEAVGSWLIVQASGYMPGLLVEALITTGVVKRPEGLVEEEEEDDLEDEAPD